MKNPINITVSTSNINSDYYSVIGPVFYQITAKDGKFSSSLFELAMAHKKNIDNAKLDGTIASENSWDILYGNLCLGANDYDIAFFVSIEELKKRAFTLNSDAIVGLNHSLSFNPTNGDMYFKVWGTAVKYQ